MELSRDRTARPRRRRLGRGGRRAPPRPHRGARRAQRVHHDRPRALAGRRPRARRPGPDGRAGRRPVRAQGSVRHRRHAHDLRLGDVPRPRSGAHRERRAADRRRRRGDRRQGEPARVRLGRDEQEPVLRNRRQPPPARPRGGRILRRQRRRARRRARGAQHRHGHGRLDPHPVVRLRHRRASSRATGSCRSTAASRSRPCFDHVGPMARTMEECALALEVLADVPRPEPRLAGLRVGVLGPIADMGRLEASGAHCEEAALPPWEHALPIFAAECAYTHRELYAERRDEYSARPPGQARARLRAARRDLPRALGRGRRLAAALRGRAALRPARRAPRWRATCRWSRRRRRPTTARE